MTLNPSGTALLMATSTLQGQGYDTRSILLLSPSNDVLVTSYIEVRNLNPMRATVAIATIAR
jgi:hypothetical protein